MLRTALKPKWLGLLVVVALLIVAFVKLGNWQMDRARESATNADLAAAAAKPVAPVQEVLTPHTPFPGAESTRKITATGHYLPGQVIVSGRRLDGAAGYWVVDPYAVQATGATLAVLRGFVLDPADAPSPPTGTVDLAGGLAPGEAHGGQVDLAAGRLENIDLAYLVNVWPTPLYDAFVFATSESVDGAQVALPAGLTRVPAPLTTGSGLNWRNAAYAWQWWFFAAFAAWMWWRMVREDRAEATADPDVPAGTGPDPDERDDAL